MSESIPSTGTVDDDSTPQDAPDPRVLFVAGSGRSGTSTFSVIMRMLGLHVPQPEVPADRSNPRGFGEPQWVVDFHDRLLRRVNVQVSDARPRAWQLTARACTRERNQAELRDWLAVQLRAADDLVVKDPRLAWFMPLWHEVVEQTGAQDAVVTMLRPPMEVVVSKERAYGGLEDNLNRTAAWLNMMLHTEQASRGSRRAFVRYHDLLDDWREPVFRVAEALDLRTVLAARDNDHSAVDSLVDPTLRRVRLTLDDVDLPPRLRELTGEAWTALDALAEPDGDDDLARARLDELREAYADLYHEAEAIAMSSVLTARAAARATRRAGTGAPPTGVRASDRSGRPTAASAPTRTSLADRVPHRLRALLPVRLRRAVRRLVPRRAGVTAGQSRPSDSR